MALWTPDEKAERAQRRRVRHARDLATYLMNKYTITKSSGILLPVAGQVEGDIIDMLKRYDGDES